MHIRPMAAPVLGLAVLLLAACGSGAGSPSAAPATAAPSAAPSEAPSASAAASPSEAAGGASIALADTPLGSVLADGEGLVLYVFTPDEAGDSTCYDECATAWPPLLSDGEPTVGDGLSAADVGATERTDGTSQVTYKGWPLYYFAGDTEPGQTNGQGLNGVWFVVTADGTMVGGPDASGGATGGVAVDLASTDLGDILVDGDGMALYMFTADADGQSACSGDCLANWPPLLSETAPTLGEGLDAADFGSITRDDGSTQVTFHDMPLYYFAGDTAAGQTNGQGVGDKWYVLLGDGTVVK